MNASEFNSPPSGTKKIIEFPEREASPEERAAEKERLLAYSKTPRARWRRFWCDIVDGRRHWRRSVWRVWGTDPQGQKHNLGMASANTEAEAIEERRGLAASSNPSALTYEISVTRLPQDKSIGERIGNCISASTWFVLRLVIFIILSYGIDYTPLAIHRIVAYFHLNQVEGLLLALFYLVILLYVANWVTGVLLPRFRTKTTRTNPFAVWYTFFWGVVVVLLIYHHYLLAGFWVLGPEWSWDGSFMTRYRWAIAQTLLRVVWFGFLVVYLVHRWL
jgi:hypothetical protein